MKNKLITAGMVLIALSQIYDLVSAAIRSNLHLLLILPVVCYFWFRAIREWYAESNKPTPCNHTANLVEGAKIIVNANGDSLEGRTGVIKRVLPPYTVYLVKLSGVDDEVKFYADEIELDNEANKV